MLQSLFSKYDLFIEKFCISLVLKKDIQYQVFLKCKINVLKRDCFDYSALQHQPNC